MKHTVANWKVLFLSAYGLPIIDTGRSLINYSISRRSSPLQNRAMEIVKVGSIVVLTIQHHLPSSRFQFGECCSSVEGSEQIFDARKGICVNLRGCVNCNPCSLHKFSLIHPVSLQGQSEQPEFCELYLFDNSLFSSLSNSCSTLLRRA